MSTTPSAFPADAYWNSALFGGPGITVGDDIVYVALRMAGILAAPGRGASSETITESLAALNALLDSWATEELLGHATERIVYPLTANQGVYTIGPSGNLAATPLSRMWSDDGGATWTNQPSVDAVRPSRIIRASVLDITSPSEPFETPLRVLDLDQWQAIADKTATSSLPSRLYYQPSFPMGTIYLYPVPTEANQIALYVSQVLGEFETVADTFFLPPGYLRAIQANLALELYGRFPEHTKLTAAGLRRLEMIAGDSKYQLELLNIPSLRMECDPALLPDAGYFDIITGDYRW